MVSVNSANSVVSILRCLPVPPLTHRKQPIEVSAKNLVPILVSGADRAQRSVLRCIDRLLPSAGEERRVRSEKDSFGTRDVERKAEDLFQRESGIVLHPPVRTRGIEVNGGALLDRHESFPQ